MREVYTKKDIPEDPKITAKREKVHIGELRRREEGAVSPELKAFLEKVDFKLLRKIFEQRAGRAGIQPRDLNFLSPERIFSDNDPRISGAYDVDYNVIFISNHQERIKSLGLEEFNRKNYSLDLEMLQALTEEEVHAVSKNSTVVDQLFTFRFQSSRSGYQIHSGRQGVLFQSFNEGVAAKLRIEIVLEYLEKSMKDEGALSWLKDAQAKYHDSRGHDIKLIDAVVKHMAERAGMPEKTVWEALVNGLFHGESFEEQEIKDLFSESFNLAQNPGFLEELPYLRDGVFSDVEIDRFIKRHIKK